MLSHPSEQEKSDSNRNGQAWTPSRVDVPRQVPRSSLRKMMLLVLLVGGGAGWMIQRVRVQREAVAAIEKAGFQVTYRWSWTSDDPSSQATNPPWPRWLVNAVGPDFFRDVVGVYSNGSDKPLVVDEILLAHISRLGHLETLIFNSTTGVTDDRLSHLANLDRLKTLDIGFCEVRGPGLKHLAGMTQLKRLNLGEIPLTDQTLSLLSPLTSLESISSNECKAVTDAGLAHLEGLVNLRSLSLFNGSRITTGGLNSLQHMSRLRSLALTESQVDSLQPIAHLTELISLRLGHNRLSDKGLKPLSNFQKLRYLDVGWNEKEGITDETLGLLPELVLVTNLQLSGTSITDKGLVHLKSLTGLASLELDHTKVGNAGMAHLAGLSSLKVLSLDFTNLTDAGVPSIAGLMSLENLSLYHTSITDSVLLSLPTWTNADT